MGRKKQTINEIIDELTIDVKKEDPVSEANKEIFIPNEKKYKIKKIIIISLLILILGLIVLYIIQSKDRISEPVIEEKKSNTSITMNRLAKLLTIDGDYTVTLKAGDIKIDSSKIKWSVEDDDIISLEKCSKLMCNIKGKNVGETILKAVYDKDNYAEMKIKVVDNQTIYIFEEESYDNQSYIWVSYDLTDIEEKPTYKYVCKSVECSYLSISNNNILINEDDNYYYYDVKNKTKKIIDYDLSKYETIEMVEGANRKVIGLILDFKNYYSLTKKDIIISTTNEDEFLLSGCGLLDYNKIILVNSDEDTTKVFSLSDGSLVKSFDKYIYYFDRIKVGNESYFIADDSFEGREFIIMNDNFNILMDNIKDYTYDNNYLYIISSNKDKVFDKYDVNLNYVDSSKEYLKVYSFCENYLIALNEDNELILTDLNDNLIHKFTTLTETMTFDSMVSGYQEDEYDSGIYLYVEDSSKGYDEYGNPYTKMYYYIPETGEYGEEEYTGGFDI